MLETFRTFIIENVATIGGQFAADAVLLVSTAVGAVVTYFLAKWLLRGLEIVVLRSPSEWDDDLLNERMLRAMAQLAPALTVDWALPAFFTGQSGFPDWLGMLTSLYILWAVIHMITIFIGNLYNALARRDAMKVYAVKGIFQMLKLVTMGVGVVIGLSILLGKEPTAILAAIGASAAVLMLVFKDTILGLVASVQLTANSMLHRGDWIEADKYGVNGEVIDVSLTTVKIRNWDNSVATIPPYTLISDSFRNYQAMRDSGGRRVDRAILIDVNTVRFCTASEIEALAGKGLLDGLEINGAEGVINLQLLRRYLERFISTDSRVNISMLHMVRQLAPTPTGLPLQLYFFTKQTAWKDFEAIQSDILDHVYAIVNEFGLAMFQSPAGTDISRR